jgi:hypothetical protein
MAAKPRRRLPRWFTVPLLLATLAVGFGTYYHYCWPQARQYEGHRRPIFFGLWQPGPRDRQSVKRRFMENIKKCGPNWGESVWGGKGTPYEGVYTGPHDYVVEVPYFGERHDFSLLVVAARTHELCTIGVMVFEGSKQVAEGRSGSRGDLELNGATEGWNPNRGECKTAADQIVDALRDALE